MPIIGGIRKFRLTSTACSQLEGFLSQHCI